MSDPLTSSHQTQQPRTSNLAATQQPRSNNSTLSMYVDARTPVLLQMATTIVYSKNRPAVPMKARLILDSGSQKSYIYVLRNELKLPSERSVTLSIKTFGSETERMQTCDAVELGLKTKLCLDLELTLYVVPFICELLSGQPTDIAVERFKYLSGLDHADPDDSDNLPISILIGADYYWKVVTGRIIHSWKGWTHCCSD